jgi:membrane protein implicated in regulation of membrane protease activity
MADEQTTTGRCAWIVLAFVLLFLHGILPGSFMGGMAGLKTAGAVLGQHAGSDLVMRLFVLLGMVVSFLVLAMISMFVTMVVSKFVANQIKRFAASDKRGEKVSLER